MSAFGKQPVSELEADVLEEEDDGELHGIRLQCKLH